MAWLCEQDAPMRGEIELNESHFGARQFHDDGVEVVPAEEFFRALDSCLTG